MKVRHILMPFVAILALECHSGLDPAAARASLLQTDKEWAAIAAAGSDVEGIIAYWADDARVYPPGMSIVEGKTAIRQFVAGSLKIPGFSVSWQPEQVVLSPDGRLGYTIGTNRITAPDSAGKLVMSRSRYVTVWRRETDGSWKCTIDIWNAGDHEGS